MSVAAPTAPRVVRPARAAPSALPAPSPRLSSVRPLGLGARLVAFGGLAAFGTARWTAMLDPRPAGRAAGITVTAVALAAALLAMRRLPRRWAAVAAVAAGAAAVAVALLCAGIPLRLLAPRHWDALAAGAGRGIDALPNLTIPYTGDASGWPARTVMAGGAVLAVLAALVGFWPRRRSVGRPWAAVVLMGVLAGVPSVVLSSGGAIAQGSALLALSVAFLALERITPPALPAAAAVVGAAVAFGALAEPRLDAAHPWFNYEAATQKLAPHAVSFDWNGSYGPLDWPRTGREMLRVAAPRSAYWKAEDLDVFNGVAWQSAVERDVGGEVESQELTVLAESHPRYVRRLRLTVRGLRGLPVVGAGEILSVSSSTHDATESVAPGTWSWDGAPSDGDTYTVRAYVPDPRPAQLASAGVDYPESVLDDRGVTMPGAGGETAVLYPPTFGSTGATMVSGPAGASTSQLIARSPYAGVWRLARSLKRGAATPYAYALAIERHLSHGFRYTESPVPSRYPLADFLLRTHAGYCQHFAGAMALLLRMGGVPARVAAGFAPGSRDPNTGEWVVRDQDAHAWVEMYYPGYGWVSFDPTPAASPAHGLVTLNHSPDQQTGRISGTASLNKDLNIPGLRHGGSGLGGHTARDGGVSGWWVALAAMLVLSAGAGLALRARRRAGQGEAERAVAELRRALRRTGRAVSPATTLAELEARFPTGGEARGYLTALRRLRYGAGGHPPTAAERRGLRRELARGLGATGALRAWWALPPAPRRRAC